MAYAYNAIEDLMQASPKQDIFSGEASQQSSPQSVQGQGQIKTSTEGDVSTGGGGSQSVEGQKSSTQQSTQPQDTNKATRAAYQANVGKTAQPSAVNTVQQQLTANAERLQNEANNYVTNQKQKQSYAIDQNSLQNATRGNQEASEKVRGLFAAPTIKSVDEFRPTDVNVSDVGLLNTSSGLQNLVARGQGPQYTKGMGAFDVRALRSSPQFQNIVNLIQNQQSDLQKKSDSLSKEKKKEVEDYGRSALSQAQSGARQYLGSEADRISAENEAEALQANQRLAQLRASGDAEAEQRALAQSRAQVLKDLQQSDPRTAKILEQVQVDPRQFGNVAQNYSGRDFVNQDEASRFNQIMSLLGEGGQFLNASAPQANPYSINQDQLRNALISGAQSKRSELDTGLRAQQQAIFDEAQKRAESKNAERLGLNLANVASERASQAADSLSPELRALYNEGLVDPNRYISRPDLTLGSRDVFNQNDVERLNYLQNELGLQDRYDVGQYASSNPLYDFNQQGYLDAVSQILQQRKSAQDAGYEAEAQRMSEDQAAAAARGASWIPGISDAGYETRPGSLSQGFTFANQSPMIYDSQGILPNLLGNYY